MTLATSSCPGTEHEKGTSASSLSSPLYNLLARKMGDWEEDCKASQWLLLTRLFCIAYSAVNTSLIPTGFPGAFACTWTTFNPTTHFHSLWSHPWLPHPLTSFTFHLPCKPTHSHWWLFSPPPRSAKKMKKKKSSNPTLFFSMLACTRWLHVFVSEHSACILCPPFV